MGDCTRLCVVSHNAYGAMTGGRGGHIGGVEWQTSLMTRWLAARGHRVSMLTWDEGGPSEETIDGVRVIKMCRQEAGVPGVRFFHPRWTSLNRAMRRADADVYYHNCGEYVTGQVAMWCRRYGRSFVYSVASDPDCDRRLPEMKTRRERVLYRYGVKRADRIIVQKRLQQKMLREGFGVDSVVIPMPCLGPEENAYVPPGPPEEGAACIAWVGRIVELKRVEMLLSVATMMPEVVFDVVGDTGGEMPYVRGILDRAANLDNVTMHGRIERSRMPAVYQQACCLCCTSEFEGFPNTFLEAWSHGLPVVSTFDPDDLIATRNLGVVARDVPGLVAGLRGLLSSPERWTEASRNARRYYLENHTVDAVMPRFERVFLDVAGRKGAGT